MINGFQSIYTITSGLVLQQLEQEINASNLANPSTDPQGYLMNSLQQVNSTTGPTIGFSDTNGLFQLDTGVGVQSITRLRSSFLDSQIQQESSVLGYYEMLANSQGTGVLNSIQSIVAGPNTLSGALTTFAAAWSSLGSNANPATDTTDRAAVVNAGLAFANLANGQYTQLQNLQSSNAQQINSTVTQINGLLQQLNSINNQLLNTPGSNQNSLLDARDYALDRLARLINIQTNIGANGTVNVYLSNSSVTLVGASGAAILQTNVENTNYPNLLGVTIQNPEGGFYDTLVGNKTITPQDMRQWITGGNLGGELQAQNAILAYQLQVNQTTTSVMDVTNNLQEAGYAADGATTGTSFFTGTGAFDIGVNPVLLSNSQLVAAALTPSAAPDTNGQVAQFLGNLPNILANNFAESQPGIGTGFINPALALATPQPYANAPASGSFTVNGNLVTYNITTDSIDSILTKIHAADPNVYAVYNATTTQFFLLSDKPISLVNVTGNFLGGVSNWSNIANVLTSTIRMNNNNAPIYSQIDFGGDPTPGANPMNSIIPSAFFFNTGPNSQAFLVVPGTSGSFTLYPPYPNGVQITWNNTMSLSQITAAIAAATGNTITASFNTTTQTLTLYDHTPLPMQIADNTGNFTAFTGLNGNVPLGSMASGLTSQITTATAVQQQLESQASNSLTQLNNAQDNIAGVNTTNNGTGPGVPVANIEQQAMQSLIAYNAMLQVMQVIDDMYSDLLNMVGASTTSPTFQQRTTLG